MGMSAYLRAEFWPCACGIPSATFLPSISIVAPSSFAAVSLYACVRPRRSARPVGKRVRAHAASGTHRVCTKPKATVLARTPNAPHSLQIVFVSPTTADLAAA